MTHNALQQLQRHSMIVADSGDITAIKQHTPRDVTTNPSLLLAAAGLPEYQPLLTTARNATANISNFYLAFSVALGRELLQVIPGRISIEVDAHMSFDTQATIARAQQIVDAFAQEGIAQSRLLIKIAATWEGIAAAAELEKAGIHCNLTLLFSLVQAAACADAGVTLISPFVGRITDWHKKQDGVVAYEVEEDPGVQSVRAIYAYYKQNKYTTEVMAASFRSIDQVIALAGCDLLTIAPNLLAELALSERKVEPLLTPQFAAQQECQTLTVDQKHFRWLLNEDAMAVEKLAEGIRSFHKAMQQLKNHMSQ